MDYEILLKSGILRKRQLDMPKITSLIESAQTTVKVAKSIQLTEESATVIFREIYESIRQLGDAYWGIKGFEPLNHEIALDALKDANVKEKLKLNNLERFKKIRHDANYRGFKVSMSQAEEIADFWDKCGIEIIEIIKSKLK